MTETDYTPTDAEVEAAYDAMRAVELSGTKMRFEQWNRERTLAALNAAARVRAKEQRDGAKVVGEGG